MNRPAAAFSLVEVVLSLGIAAFALVALLGVLPLGLQSHKEASEQIAAVNLASTIIADLQNAGDGSETSARYGVNLRVGSEETRLFNEADEIVTDSSAQFRVLIKVLPPDSTVHGRRVHLSIVWPASATSYAVTKIETDCILR